MHPYRRLLGLAGAVAATAVGASGTALLVAGDRPTRSAGTASAGGTGLPGRASERLLLAWPPDYTIHNGRVRIGSGVLEIAPGSTVVAGGGSSPTANLNDPTFTDCAAMATGLAVIGDVSEIVES